MLKKMARNTDCLQTESLHASETDSLLPFDHKGLHLGHVVGECWWYSVAGVSFTS